MLSVPFYYRVYSTFIGYVQFNYSLYVNYPLSLYDLQGSIHYPLAYFMIVLFSLYEACWGSFIYSALNYSYFMSYHCYLMFIRDLYRYSVLVMLLTLLYIYLLLLTLIRVIMMSTYPHFTSIFPSLSIISVVYILLHVPSF